MASHDAAGSRGAPTKHSQDRACVRACRSCASPCSCSPSTFASISSGRSWRRTGKRSRTHPASWFRGSCSRFPAWSRSLRCA
ncbi:hypothetical protein FAZ97_30905 [Paraburkholderia acidiphila]|uniref:Uncharacterized protein n=1 Tax=Paraburkholderia acidiphila TaxID=2571747 RepID=A0A7Z2GEP1_9BURK|nr:hypothetical protein FAZ97_30905 [Paraburkholderia acidiphila]